MTTPRGSLDLTLVSRLDDQQLSSTIQRRSSLPLERFVSILDEHQQSKNQQNEAVLKAIDKIKRLKCECVGKEEKRLRLPVVNVVPSTPQFHTIASERARIDRGHLSVIEADNVQLGPDTYKEKKKNRHRYKHKSV